MAPLPDETVKRSPAYAFDFGFVPAALTGRWVVPFVRIDVVASPQHCF
jgi:hypothetical protein